MRASRRASCVAALLLFFASSSATGHPMPNSVIQVTMRPRGATLDIAVPVPELRLALPLSWPKDANLLVEPQRAIVESYFLAHVAARSRTGVAQPASIESVTIEGASDENVGRYQELRVRMFVPSSGGFDPRDFVLAYDAVIHQVPTHFALVQTGDRAAGAGVIRFDFARNETPPLAIVAAPETYQASMGATNAVFAAALIGLAAWKLRRWL